MVRRIFSGTRSTSTLLVLLPLLAFGWTPEGGAQGTERAPRLVAPPDSAGAVLPGRPEFRWEGVDSGRASILQIARDSAFADLVFTDSSASIDPPLPRGVLRNDSSYFWRVGVGDSLGGAEFSVPRKFTVAPPVGLTPGMIFLGYVPNGDSARATVILNNPLPFPITLDSISGRPGPFRILAPLPAVIDSLDSLIFSVRFAPDGFLVFSESIRLHTTLGDRMLVVTGDSPPPLCMAAAQEVRLGAVALGDTASAVVVVYNGGVVNPLRVQRLSHRSKAFHVRKAYPFTIPPGDSVHIPLRFVPGSLRPARFGRFDDTLVIESNGGSVSIALVAKSPPPRLNTRPGAVDFGEVALQDSTLRMVLCTNASVNPLRIDSLKTGTGGFSAGPFRGVLRFRDTVFLPVRFMPGRYGIHRDTLRIFCGAPAQVFRVPLGGSAPPPLLVTDRKAIQFGQIPSREAGRLLLGVSNGSISPLTIDSITSRTRVFRVENLPGNASLEMGDTLRLQVSFIPDSAGYFRDTLVIWNNSLLPRVLVALSGTGRNVLPSGDEGPGSFTLCQNFPNPFNEITTFRYALPERCAVRLTVFNSLGQTIATVVDSEQEEGYHNVIWRPETASGMYFYKLIAVPAGNPDRQHVASKRLMVLR